MEEGVEVVDSSCENQDSVVDGIPQASGSSNESLQGRALLPKRHQPPDFKPASAASMNGDEVAAGDEDEDSKRRRLDGNEPNFRRRSRSAGRQYRSRADGSESEGETTVSQEREDPIVSTSPAEVNGEDSQNVDLMAAVEAMEDDEEDSRDSPPSLADAAGPSRTRRLLADLSSSDDDSSSSVEDGGGARAASDDDVDSEYDSDDGAIFRPLRRRGRTTAADVEGEPSPEFLAKKPRKEKFFLPEEVMRRSYGLGAGKRHDGLAEKFYSSLNAVKRLKMTHKLDFHTGCVNALGFNSSGQVLASGSDDLKVAMWDWARQKLLYSYDSGHESNIFQVRFLPLQGDTHLVTSARDGAVRLGELSSAGSCKSTRLIAEHRAPVPKIAVSADEPYVVLSAAEDGTVSETDIRGDRTNKLFKLKDPAGMRIGLYSVSMNPSRSQEFCVCGCDATVRVYDRRHVKPLESLLCFIPAHLRDSPTKTHVTSAEYNHDGTEIAASYKDDDVFLFNRYGNHGVIGDFVKRYEGRRNNSTVKSLSFFGPKSEYVVSGSDCGNIFFWDKETEAVVHFVHGDDNGVVNVPLPHPFFPVMASCGLDNEVKIWMPLENEPPNYQRKLETTAKRNIRERESDLGDGLGSQNNMLWLLWRHLRRARRSRRREPNDGDSSDSDSSSSDSDDSDEMSGARPVCTTT